MTKIDHPLFPQSYTKLESGLVRVEDRNNGKTGTFDSRGNWVGGRLRTADRHMITYVASLAATPSGR